MRFSIFIFFLLGLLISYNASAQSVIIHSTQHERYFTLGFNAGSFGTSPSHLNATSSDYFIRTKNPGLGTLEDHDGNQHLSLITNNSIGACIGFLQKNKNNHSTSIDFEFQKNRACYSFDYPFPYTYHGKDQNIWVDSDDYLKYSVAVMRTWQFYKWAENNTTFWYIRESFGQTFHHTNFNEKLSTNFEEDWTEAGTGMKLKVVSLHQKTLIISSEIGRRHYLKDGKILDIGIVFHQPFTSTRSVQYEFFKSGVSSGTSTINYLGSTIMLNMRYLLTYKLKERPVDSTKTKKYDNLAQHVKHKDSSEITTHNTVHHSNKINGRKFNIEESVMLTNGTVTLSVWDKNRIDGDEISLYLNGKLILENFIVSKTRKEVVVTLEPGSNILVMHALNLGKIPPNTAALNIDDGALNKNITLVSTLKKSGALEIIYKP